jgi:hypothetical protein
MLLALLPAAPSGMARGARFAHTWAYEVAKITFAIKPKIKRFIALL